MLRKKVALAASLAALAAGGTALAGGQNQIKTPVSTVPVADEGALPNQHSWNRLAFGFGRWWGAVPLYYVPLRESVPVPREPEIQLAGLSLNGLD